jgi:uncharacterized repeat protein (TIGR02543 family)
MKKTIKGKTLSLLTSATMVLSLCTLPISVQAEENLTEKEKINNSNVSTTVDNSLSGNCGATENDNVTWELSPNNDGLDTYTLTITGNGMMKDYKDQSEVPWNQSLENITQKNITQGIVNEGITHLGARTFVLTTSLKSVNLPQSLESIGESAFNQSALASIIFPSNLKTIGKNAFWHGNLTGEIKIPDSVKTIGDHAFDQNKLTKVTLPDELKELGSGAFKANSLTVMPEIPLGITSLSCTFQDCKQLTDINIPSHVTNLDRTFMGCENLTSVTIPETVESYVGTFYGCTGLTSAIIESKSDNIGGSNTSVATGVFGECTKLETIVVPEWVTVIGMAAFKGCSSLKTTNFIEKAEVINQQAFSGCTSLTGNLNLSAKVIESHAFDNCTGLGPNISVGNAESIFSRAFWDCSNINGIVYAQTISGGANNFAHRTITALLNGGKISTGTDLSSNNLAQPIKEGYKFEGWYDNANFNGEAVTVPQADSIYYAKWKEKHNSTISFKSDLNLNKNYDGKAVSISEDDYRKTEGAGNVTFSYQIKNNNDWLDVDYVPTNAGTYRVKAVVAENDEYKKATTDWKEFTIQKIKPTYTLPSDLVVTVGKSLFDIILPNGFAWVDETQTATELGTHDFKAIYTPEDTENYETVEVMISVEVIPGITQINHAPEIEVSDKTLTVGDVFNPMENVVVKDKEDNVNDLVVDVTHNVDTSKAGVYEVTYKVTDSQGASSTKTIKVTVKEKDTPPVVTSEPDAPNKDKSNINEVSKDTPPVVTSEPDALNTDKSNINKVSNDKDSVQTGDQVNIGFYTSLFAVSTLGITILIVWKKKRTLESK